MTAHERLAQGLFRDASYVKQFWHEQETIPVLRDGRVAFVSVLGEAR